jgi:mRNA interferase RelE/StbE
MTSYKVYVLPDAWGEIKELPGHMRQRVQRAVAELASEPRPAQSKSLNVATTEPELRRLRFDRWRVVYAIDDAEPIVDVLAVRKRPPYDYGDLEQLLADFM